MNEKQRTAIGRLIKALGKADLCPAEVDSDLKTLCRNCPYGKRLPEEAMSDACWTLWFEDNGFGDKEDDGE